MSSSNRTALVLEEWLKVFVSDSPSHFLCSPVRCWFRTQQWFGSVCLALVMTLLLVGTSIHTQGCDWVYSCWSHRLGPPHHCSSGVVGAALQWSVWVPILLVVDGARITGPRCLHSNLQQCLLLPVRLLLPGELQPSNQRMAFRTFLLKKLSWRKKNTCGATKRIDQIFALQSCWWGIGNHTLSICHGRMLNDAHRLEMLSRILYYFS